MFLGTRFELIDRSDIEIDIDINDFIDFYLCQLLNDHIGDKVNSNPFELAYQITKEIADAGTLCNSEEQAMLFIKHHPKNVFRQIKYEYEEFGELKNDPYENPEAFQVGLLITNIEERLAGSQYLKDLKNKDFILTDEACSEIKADLEIVLPREIYLEKLYNPEPNAFVLESFGKDFDSAVGSLLGYSEYLEKGYLEVMPDVRDVINKACQGLSMVGSNYITEYTKLQCDAAAKALRSDLADQIQQRNLGSESKSVDKESSSRAFKAFGNR